MLQTFLAIIGGIVVAIVALLVLGLIVVRWKLRKLVQQFEDIAEATGKSGHIVPPMRVRLRPDNSHEWLDDDRVRSIGDELSDKGFVRIGTFSTEPETIPLEAWHDPERSIYATINEHPLAGVWLDYVSLGQDGSMFTVSSGPGDEFPRPDNFQIEHATGADADELLQKFLSTRPDHVAVQTSAQSFASAFEDAWKRMMEFRVEQGTPSDDEIRRLCFSNPDEADDATVDQIRDMWQTEIVDVRHRQVRESYLGGSNLTALEWDRMRDRTVFVYDELPASELALMLERAVEDDFDEDFGGDPYEAFEDRIRELLQNESPRTVFSQLNEECEPEKRFEKIGEITEPVVTDVYLGVEDEDY